MIARRIDFVRRSFFNKKESNCWAGEQHTECGFVALTAVESSEKCNGVHRYYQEMDLKHSTIVILALEAKIRLTPPRTDF